MTDCHPATSSHLFWRKDPEDREDLTSTTALVERVHIVVGETEMMADLVDQHLAHQVAQG